MKTQAKMPKKEAACLRQTARKTKLYNERYLKSVSLSNLKMQIGEFLILLLAGNGQPNEWEQFERLLRRYYDGGVL